MGGLHSEENMGAKKMVREILLHKESEKESMSWGEMLGNEIDCFHCQSCTEYTVQVLCSIIVVLIFHFLYTYIRAVCS